MLSAHAGRETCQFSLHACMQWYNTCFFDLRLLSHQPSPVPSQLCHLLLDSANWFSTVLKRDTLNSFILNKSSRLQFTSTRLVLTELVDSVLMRLVIALHTVISYAILYLHNPTIYTMTTEKLIILVRNNSEIYNLKHWDKDAIGSIWRARSNSWLGDKFIYLIELNFCLLYTSGNKIHISKFLQLWLI